MKKFTIIIKNKKTKKNKTQEVQALSFPEAVSAAYASRGILGHDWEIVSIKNKEEN